MFSVSLQVFFRPFEAKPREREAAGLVGFGKCFGGNGKALGEFAAHANGLRTLSGKKEGDLFDHCKEDCSGSEAVFGCALNCLAPHRLALRFASESS